MLHIFSECGIECGYGHIYRCTSLIEHFPTNNFNVVWHIKLDSMTDTIPIVIGQIEIGDWSKIAFSEFYSESDVYLFDAYTINLNSYLQAITGTNILSITDAKLNYYDKGVVLCPSLYSEALFKGGGPKQLFHGDQYFFTSLELNNYIQHDKEGCADVKTIGISLGGTVHSERLQSIISLIQSVYPDADLHQFGSALPPKQGLHSYGFISRVNYFEIISSMDLVVTGSGQALNEVAIIGLPVVPIALNESQSMNRDFWLQKLSLRYKCTLYHDNFNENFTKSLEYNKGKTLPYRDREYLLSGAKRLSNALVKKFPRALCI